MNRSTDEILIGIADAIHDWSRAAGLKEGVKVLAEALDEHWVTTYRRLRGDMPLTPTHLRAMAARMGAEHGRALWQAAAGDDYLVITRPGSSPAEDLTQAAARSMSAEGRLVDMVCDACRDGEITMAEADRLVGAADSVATLVAGIKAAVRAGRGSRR